MTDWQSLDPEAAREAEKYENPIPSRELILAHLTARGSAANREQLVEAFGLTTDDEIEALRRRLRAMERDGQLIYTRRGAYTPIDEQDLIRGKILSHRDGFGFLQPEDGSEDLFIGPNQMRTVFDGDICLAQVSGVDRRGRREGAIAKVISRAHSHIVGRFQRDGDTAFVVSDNPKIQQEILVTPGATLDAKVGQFVEVQITHWPTPRFQAQGEVVEVIGNYMAPGMEIDVALRSFDIPFQWPDDVRAEAAQLGREVSEKDKQRRVDLRALPFVTIDGEDARDFDDAVYCEKVTGEPKFKNCWRLYVAIADVSHYVPVGSALDREAHERGNSVYFPERVVPMLPEELSNGLCSLNPNVDRLAMVCAITLSAQGEMQDYEFFEAVINSHARLTYDKVAVMLEEGRSAEARRLRSEYSEIMPALKELHGLFEALLKARHERGAIDFETQETRIVFGEDRKIETIKPTQRNDAHRLIEECMLCANVATAAFLQEHDVLGLYRVHDSPPVERLDKLRSFLAEQGLSLTYGQQEPTPKDYQALLEQVRERPDFQLLQTVMLRSLSQAVYSSDNNGHFGLNYEAYTHFTSPIRRYPDLLAHRAIRSVIRSRRKSERVRRVGAGPLLKRVIYPYDQSTLDQMADHCSMTERRADEATRDVVSWLKCEFMRSRVGDSYEGVITAVTGFGLFVELKDIYVEGLVHISQLPTDYYEFDAAHFRLTGERSGRSYRLGDSVYVRVMRVDLDQRKIDFELDEQQGGKSLFGRTVGGVSPQVQHSREMRKNLLQEAKFAQREKTKAADAERGDKPFTKPKSKAGGKKEKPSTEAKKKTRNGKAPKAGKAPKKADVKAPRKKR